MRPLLPDTGTSCSGKATGLSGHPRSRNWQPSGKGCISGLVTPHKMGSHQVVRSLFTGSLIRDGKPTHQHLLTLGFQEDTWPPAVGHSCRAPATPHPGNPGLNPSPQSHQPAYRKMSLGQFTGFFFCLILFFCFLKDEGATIGLRRAKRGARQTRSTPCHEVLEGRAGNGRPHATPARPEGPQIPESSAPQTPPPPGSPGAGLTGPPHPGEADPADPQTLENPALQTLGPWGARPCRSSDPGEPRSLAPQSPPDPGSPAPQTPPDPARCPRPRPGPHPAPPPSPPTPRGPRAPAKRGRLPGPQTPP